MKDGVIIINSARAELVNLDDVKTALGEGKVRAYVVDFPTFEALGDDKITAIPHLGASTEESEENCAVMASESLIEYMEKGNVVNSVNLPNLSVEPTKKHRYTVISVEDKEYGGVSAVKNGLRYTIIDCDDELDTNNFADSIKWRKVF